MTSIQLYQTLREQTGRGFADVKTLTEANGDMEQPPCPAQKGWPRPAELPTRHRRGHDRAQSRGDGRRARRVNCETDFVDSTRTSALASSREVTRRARRRGEELLARIGRARSIVARRSPRDRFHQENIPSSASRLRRAAIHVGTYILGGKIASGLSRAASGAERDARLSAKDTHAHRRRRAALPRRET